jgi:signal transduction histidine kinase
MQKQFKEMHKWMNYHVYFSLIASILYFVLPYPELIISLMRIGLISSVLIVAWSLRNNGELSPTESKLMLGSLMFLIAAGILLGINQWTVWLPTALLFGWGIAFIAMHILWISVSILYRVKKLNDKRESLWLDIRQTKKDLLDRYLKGVEEEKFRIVYELENNVLVEIESLKGAIVSLPESNLETQKELDRIQSSVTNITSELIGNQVTHSRFIIQIENFVARHQSDKTQFSLHFFNFSGGLLPEVEEQLYRIIQEAVQNIEKYANASTVEIQIIQNETELILSIEDNGDGFDPKEKSDGIGVLNMRKRAFDIGGTLNISTSLGNGTSIFVALSLRN